MILILGRKSHISFALVTVFELLVWKNYLLPTRSDLVSISSQNISPLDITLEVAVSQKQTIQGEIRRACVQCVWHWLMGEKQILMHFSN